MRHEGFDPQPLKDLWTPALTSPSGHSTPPLQPLSIHKIPWCRKHGEKHGIHGETLVSPCFPCFTCFSMLCKSMEKHGKHGNIFQVTPAEHGLAWNSWDRTFLSFRIAWKSMGSMEQHFLMISDSMGKHGEHGNSSFS